MTGLKLTGRAALVTGAGGGIGRAICQAFAHEGARVLCTDIDGDTARETARLLGPSGSARPCDVRQGDQAKAAVDAAQELFGGLHVLVNCAAVFQSFATLPDLDEEVWNTALDVNVTGAYHMSRFAVPLMAASGGGSIIHVASQMATVACRGYTAYCVTKGALLMLAKGMALDHAEQTIRTNSLSPGGIATQGMADKWGAWRPPRRNGANPSIPWDASAGRRKSPAPRSSWPAMIHPS